MTIAAHPIRVSMGEGCSEPVRSSVEGLSFFGAAAAAASDFFTAVALFNNEVIAIAVSTQLLQGDYQTIPYEGRLGDCWEGSVDKPSQNGSGFSPLAFFFI